MTAKLLMIDIRNYVLASVALHCPDDTVLVDCSLLHLPAETSGLLPALVVYLQVNGTDKADGLYLSQVIPPSAATEANLDAVVKQLADQSAAQRAEIRASLARGDVAADESWPIPI